MIADDAAVSRSLAAPGLRVAGTGALRDRRERDHLPGGAVVRNCVLLDSACTWAPGGAAQRGRGPGCPHHRRLPAGIASARHRDHRHGVASEREPFDTPPELPRDWGTARLAPPATHPPPKDRSTMSRRPARPWAPRSAPTAARLCATREPAGRSASARRLPTVPVWVNRALRALRLVRGQSTGATWQGRAASWIHDAAPGLLRPVVHLRSVDPRHLDGALDR
ncbi:hypothetical protein QJS66_23020 [Kocuria rhizophila]|nr:hypothetical protein QJS66_23020 [Kocuria rhizophila]